MGTHDSSLYNVSCIHNVSSNPTFQLQKISDNIGGRFPWLQAWRVDCCLRLTLQQSWLLVCAQAPLQGAKLWCQLWSLLLCSLGKNFIQKRWFCDILWFWFLTFTLNTCLQSNDVSESSFCRTSEPCPETVFHPPDCGWHVGPWSECSSEAGTWSTLVGFT